MLTCRELTELVTAHVERRLSLWERLQFQLHLGMCRHCREYLRQMETTRKTLGALPSEPPPPEVEAELLRRFADWKSSRTASAE